MEKTIVIVMDEEKFEEQIQEIYALRKSSIQVYDGNKIPVINQK